MCLAEHHRFSRRSARSVAFCSFHPRGSGRTAARRAGGRVRSRRPWRTLGTPRRARRRGPSSRGRTTDSAPPRVVSRTAAAPRVSRRTRRRPRRTARAPTALQPVRSRPTGSAAARATGVARASRRRGRAGSCGGEWLHGSAYSPSGSGSRQMPQVGLHAWQEGGGAGICVHVGGAVDEAAAATGGEQLRNPIPAATSQRLRQNLRTRRELPRSTNAAPWPDLRPSSPAHEPHEARSAERTDVFPTAVRAARDLRTLDRGRLRRQLAASSPRLAASAALPFTDGRGDRAFGRRRNTACAGPDDRKVSPTRSPRRAGARSSTGAGAVAPRRRRRFDGAATSGVAGAFFDAPLDLDDDEALARALQAQYDAGWRRARARCASGRSTGTG